MSRWVREVQIGHHDAVQTQRPVPHVLGNLARRQHPGETTADSPDRLPLLPALQAEWGLSDAQLGALVSVVSVTVGLGAFPAALLVDRWSRVRAIALMGTVWSLAAAAAGAAQSFGQLLTARAALGVGEAGYGPAAGVAV